MAEASAPTKTLESYTIKGTNKIIKAGDSVLMRPVDPENTPSVAKVKKIESDGRVQVQWYYCPEQSNGGRRSFHGKKELFLSNHFDVQNVDRIVGKCEVHSFKSYTKLDQVRDEDYYCRLEYNYTTGAFSPDRIQVYCSCEMPMNPDDLMFRCEDCRDRFHSPCVGMTDEIAGKLKHFFCPDCASN